MTPAGATISLKMAVVVVNEPAVLRTNETFVNDGGDQKKNEGKTNDVDSTEQTI